MDRGVSSFNNFIHELSVDSDASSLDYSSGEEDWDSSYPSSPLSQSSQCSRERKSSRNSDNWPRKIMLLLAWIFVPLKCFFLIPFKILRSLHSGSTVPSPREVFHSSEIHSFKRRRSLKDHVIHRTTDKRRGVIEDIHLASEIFIDAIFEFFRKAARIILSPSAFSNMIRSWFSSDNNSSDGLTDDQPDTNVPIAALGESDVTTPDKSTSFSQFLNTDARTCQDVITELGYPYEAIKVITSDGYVLLLERIPRRDSRKAVYLQHGVLDSAMGWVSNGIVGSPAFAAYDQGYDVFLGNLRGLVSREHINANIAYRKYWQYSINEHGMEDIPAMIEEIHKVKTAELQMSEPDSKEETNEQPYKLCAVCHSLGGAAILMYVITRHIEEKPHRLSRLILLSPAGFHHDSNLVFTAAEFLFLLFAPVLASIIPAFYIPTRFFRLLLNKLARDFHHYPAVGGLVQTLMSYVVGGDSSNWIGVLGLPHYNMNDMPGVSFRVVHHLAQMKHSKKFRMYDYGSVSENLNAYGSREPLDLGEYYNFINIPVDLVAGQKDNVIRPSMVRKHYKLMKEAQVEVSYSEFEYAHLDFTFSHREELLAYVMSRLLLVDPSCQKSMKLKRKDK